MGNQLLVAGIVHKAAGGGQVISEEMSTLMPGLAGVLQTPSITALELECLKDLQPSDCSELGFSQGTARVSAAKAQGRLEPGAAVSCRPPGQGSPAQLWRRGAAPLLASAAAYGDSKLTNNFLNELRVLLRLRLGMLPHPGAPSFGICQRQGCGKPVDACGLHHPCELEGLSRACQL